jgi:hypothetical protein
VALVAGLAGSVFGLGASGQAPEIFDGSSWLWSRPVGEVSRVNGNSGVVDLRHPVEASRGGLVRVRQTTDFLLLHDVDTGQLYSVDLTRMGFAGRREVQPGSDVVVALSGSDAVVTDRARGRVRAVDPVSLQVRGEPLQLPPGLVGGDFFDDSGVLWLGVPSQGTVAAVTVDDGQVAVDRTLPVADPGAALAVSVLDQGVLVVDQRRDRLVVADDEVDRELPAPVPLAGAQVPARSVGGLLVVTVPEQRAMVVVEDVAGSGTPRQVPLPDGAGTAVPFAGRIYVPDDAGGVVHVFDPDGSELEPIELPDAAGLLELEVRQELLFINAVDAPVAAVVDAEGQLSLVDKFDPEAGLPGPTEEPEEGDSGGPSVPIPRAAPRPPQPEEPSEPPPGPPGVPAPVTVLAGDQQVQVSWAAAATTGDADVDRYRVTWDGADSGEVEVAGDQLSTVVTGLENGEEYQFRVVAENEFGQSPPALSEPVVPVAGTLSRPQRPTAEVDEARVTVSWPAVAGASEYVVTPLREGEAGVNPPQTVADLSAEFEGLTLGAGYTFTVVARNADGAASDPSQPSEEVVPFSVPDPPEDLAAERLGDGDLRIEWSEPDDNGREIEGYLVRDGDGDLLDELTGTELTVPGADGLTEVSVSAVNQAGEGESATVDVEQDEEPTDGGVTITEVRPMDEYMRVSFEVADGLSPDECEINIDGRNLGIPNTQPADCGGSLSANLVERLSPSTTYGLEVTAIAEGVEYTDQQQFTTYPEGVGGTLICEGDDLCSGNGAPAFLSPSADVSDAFQHHPHGTDVWMVCRTDGPSFDATPYGGTVSDVWVMKSNSATFLSVGFIETSADIDAIPLCTH